MTILRIALPIPKRQLFDYSYQGPPPKLGVRVQVPFGPRTMIGLLWEIADSSTWPEDKLKVVIQVLDEQPVFNATGLPPIINTLLAMLYKPLCRLLCAKGARMSLK